MRYLAAFALAALTACLLLAVAGWLATGWVEPGDY